MKNKVIPPLGKTLSAQKLAAIIKDMKAEDDIAKKKPVEDRLEACELALMEIKNLLTIYGFFENYQQRKYKKRKRREDADGTFDREGNGRNPNDGSPESNPG